jgi:hypothetical protein
MTPRSGRTGRCSAETDTPHVNHMRKGAGSADALAPACSGSVREVDDNTTRRFASVTVAHDTLRLGDTLVHESTLDGVHGLETL